MTIQEQAKQFDTKFAELSEAREKAVGGFYEEFLKVYNDVLPIINVMKKHSVYFTHPNLPDVCSVHGPIIGRNNGKRSEIFVLRDNVRVFAVGTYDDIIDDERPITLANFVKICDHRFAWAGLIPLYTRLFDVLMQETKNVNELVALANELNQYGGPNQCV